MSKECSNYTPGGSCDLVRQPLGCNGEQPKCLYPAQFTPKVEQYTVTSASGKDFLFFDEPDTKTRGIVEGQSGIVFEARPMAREVLKSRLQIIEGGKGV